MSSGEVLRVTVWWLNLVDIYTVYIYIYKKCLPKDTFLIQSDKFCQSPRFLSKSSTVQQVIHDPSSAHGSGKWPYCKGT